MLKWFRNLIIYFLLFYALMALTGFCPCDFNFVDFFKQKVGEMGKVLTNFSKDSPKSKPKTQETKKAKPEKTIDEIRMEMIDKAMSTLTQPDNEKK